MTTSYHCSYNKIGTLYTTYPCGHRVESNIDYFYSNNEIKQYYTTSEKCPTCRKHSNYTSNFGTRYF